MINVTFWENEDYATITDGAGNHLGSVKKHGGAWRASALTDPDEGPLHGCHASPYAAGWAVSDMASEERKRERRHTCRWCDQPATTTVGLKNPSASCSGCAKDRTGEITAERALAAYKRQTDDMVQQDRRVTTALNEASDAITRLQGERDALEAEVVSLQRYSKGLVESIGRASRLRMNWMRAAFHGDSLPLVVHGRVIVGYWSHSAPGAGALTTGDGVWVWLQGHADGPEPTWLVVEGPGWQVEAGGEAAPGGEVLWWDPLLVDEALAWRPQAVTTTVHFNGPIMDISAVERAVKAMAGAADAYRRGSSVALVPTGLVRWGLDNGDRVFWTAEAEPTQRAGRPQFITADERAERKPLGDMPGSRAVCGWPSYEEDE